MVRGERARLLDAADVAEGKPYLRTSDLRAAGALPGAPRELSARAEALPPAPAPAEKSRPSSPMAATAFWSATPVDAWSQAVDEADAAARAATEYVVGFAADPELRAGDRFQGDLVLEVDDALDLAILQTEGLDDSIDRASKTPGVLFAEPNTELAWVDFVPVDVRAHDQWSLREVRAFTAWDTTLGDVDAAVCIVDTGVRLSHEDLGASRYLGGYNVLTGSSDPSDDNGHGTHVAGIAAATVDNGAGIAGAGNVGWYAVKVLNAAGQGSMAAIAAGIQWCVDNTIPNTVVSLSLGAPLGSFAVRTAVENAWASGRVVVAAAGNSGPCVNCVGFPARYEEVIAVGCTNAEGALCGFSSTGPQLDAAAPGEGILSTYHFADASYETLSGTSMSTPLVSGALALAWSHEPTLTAAQLRARLESALVDRGAPGLDAGFGHGVLDMACLVAAAASCADELAPILRRAEFEGDGTLVLRFSEPLDTTSIPAAADLAISAGDAILPIATLSIDANALRATLATEAPVDVEIAVSYAPAASPIQDGAGNDAEAMSGILVDTSLLPTPGTEEGGPDGGGYVFQSSRLVDGPAFAWTDVAGIARRLPLSDDDVEGPIPIPFPFVFYGVTHREVYVSSNGYVTFDPADDDSYCDEQILPDPTTPNNLVAGLWRDLYPPASDAGVTYATVGEAGARTFVISYDAVPNYGDDVPQSFQIKLFEADHAIETHYARVTTDDWCGAATLGIEGPGGASGLTYLYGDASFEARAVRFEPTLPAILTDIVTPASPIVAVEFPFTARTSGGAPIVSWAWDFGDGATSAEEAPTHAFEQSGTFHVKLVVTDAEGMSGSTRRAVRVLEPGSLALAAFGHARATAGASTYLFGGTGDRYDALDAIVVYDHATGASHLNEHHLPTARTLAAAAWGGDAFYVFGGVGPEGALDEIVRYDPATGAVAILASRLPAPMEGSTAVFDERTSGACPTGCIYLVGGYDGTSGMLVPAILRFDPASGDITTMGSRLDVGLWRPAAEIADGVIAILGGGRDDGYPDASIRRFDPIADSIGFADAAFPGPLAPAASATDGAFVYVAGGLDAASTIVDAAYRYDPARDVVLPLASALATPRHSAAATWDGEAFVVLAGRGPWSAVLSSIERLSPTTAALAGPTLAYDAASSEGDVLTDLSGHDDHGMILGATRVGEGTAESPFALSFDGVDDVVATTLRRADIREFSVAARLRTTTPGGAILALHDVQTGAASQRDAQLLLDEDGRARFEGSHGALLSRTAVADGGWHDIMIVAANAGTREGVALYVDGVLQDRALAPHGYEGSAGDVGGYWRIGESSFGEAPPVRFKGEIAEIAIHSRALTNAELAPAFYGGVVRAGDPSTLVLFSSERIDPATLPSADVLSLLADGLPLAVSAIDVRGDHALLRLGSDVAHGARLALAAESDGPADFQGSRAPPFAIEVANLVGDPLLERSDAPDAGGYTFLSSVAPGGEPFEFIDISQTGEPALVAPWTWAIPLDFEFEYYGTAYRHVHLAEGGRLSFGKELPRATCASTPVPDAGGFAGVVALDTVIGADDGAVRYQTLGSAPERVFIAQWTNVREWGDGVPLTFQIRLYESDGRIATAYRDASLKHGSLAYECPARAGIQAQNGTMGLSYRLGIADLSGIQVVYRPPAGGLAASFTLSQDAPLVDELIDLADASTLASAPTSWSWSFGDGDTSALERPSHVWTHAGTYFVTLTTTDALGAQSVAVRRVEVGAPGVTEQPALILSAGFAHGGFLYSAPTSLVPSYSGLGGAILRYDPARNLVTELEAEVPAGNLFGSTASTGEGAYILAPFAPDLSFGAVYFFDPLEGTVRFRDGMPFASLLGAGGWDPTPTPECPAGCAYVLGGVIIDDEDLGGETDAHEGLPGGLGGVIRHSPATHRTEILPEILAEPIAYHAVAARPGRLSTFGGMDATSAFTDAITSVDVWSLLATIMPEGLDVPMAFPAAEWTGERFVLLAGIDDKGVPTPTVWSYDPYSGDLVVLGSFSEGHASGAFAYTGAGVAVLGGLRAGPSGGNEYTPRAEFLDLPPQARSTDAAGNLITIIYSEPLGPGFSVTAEDYLVTRNGVPAAIVGVSILADRVLLTLAETIAHGDVLRLDYAPPARATSTGSSPDEPMGFSGHPIANREPPRLVTTPSTPDGLAGWFNTVATVVVEGEGDRLYCLGAGCTPSVRYAEPIAIQEGETTVRARSLHDGAATDIVELVARVDLTKPTVTPGGDSGTLSGTSASVTFAFSERMDPASTDAALVRGAEWSPAWSADGAILTLSASGLPAGAHTLTLGAGARDAHGQPLASPSSRSVTSPGPPPPPPPPAPQAAAPPPPPTPPGAPTSLAAALNGTAVTLTWSPPAELNGGSVRNYAVSVDGGPSQSVEARTFVASALARGATHAFRVAAVTEAGEGSPAITSLGILPVSTLATAQANANGWHTTAPIVTLSADPASATVLYDVGEAERTYDAPIAIPEGATTLRWRARAGGLEEAPQQRIFRVDSIAPTVSGAAILEGASITFRADALDAGSGVASVRALVSTGGGAPLSIPLTRGAEGDHRGSAAPAPGVYDVTFVALDAAGNEARASAGSINILEAFDDEEKEEEPADDITTDGSSSGGPSIGGGSTGAGDGGAAAAGIPIERSSTTDAGGTSSTGTSEETPPPPKPAIVIEMPEAADVSVDAGARGVVTVRLTGVDDPGSVFIVLVTELGDESILSDGAFETTWDTTQFVDGYYTLEARRRPAAPAAGELSIASSHASGVTLASERVLVRNPQAPMATVAGAAVAGVMVAAATHAGLSAVTSGATSAAGAAGGGFDPFGFAQEVAIDAGQDKLRDKTKARALDRKRRIRSWIAAIGSLAILAALWALSEAESWTFADWLAMLPIVGAAAAIVTLLKFTAEGSLAWVTHARPRVRLWVAGTISLIVSSVVFRNPFGYPGYVEERGESEARNTWRMQGLRGAATIAGATSFMLPFLALSSIAPWQFVAAGLLIAITNAATTAMPFGPLPGRDVWRWNKPLAIVLALAGFALYVLFATAIAPVWTLWAIGITGGSLYVAALIGFRRTLGPKPKSVRVPVSVPIPVIDADRPAAEQKESPRQGP